MEQLENRIIAEEMQQELPQQDIIEVQADVIEETETVKEVSMNEL